MFPLHSIAEIFAYGERRHWAN